MAGENDFDDAVDNVFGSTLAPDPTASNQPDVNEQDDDISTQQNELESQEGNENNEENSSGEEDPYSGLAPALKGPPKRDKDGNILGADGKPVATNRQERRDFYAYHRLRSAAEKIKENNTRLETELASLRHIADMPARLGLQLNDVQEAIELRAQFDRDPVQAVREVVARVLNDGYTMEQLFGAEAPGYINSQMVKQQIEQHMRPLNERLQTEQREQQYAQQAEKDMNAFLEEHEFADIHGPQIVAIVQEHDMSPQKAYYELRRWADSNGFDFSQPIGPQVTARQQQQCRPQDNQQQQPPVRQQSTPGNRRVGPTGVATAPVSNYAPVDQSFRDIVADAFRSLATN